MQLFMREREIEEICIQDRQKNGAFRLREDGVTK